MRFSYLGWVTPLSLADFISCGWTSTQYDKLHPAKTTCVIFLIITTTTASLTLKKKDSVIKMIYRMIDMLAGTVWEQDYCC